MKYLKILGLAAIAAAALMAFAGSASATVLTGTGCAEAGCGVGTKIESASEGHAVLDSPIGRIECNSTVSGAIENAGGGSATVSGKISTLDFTGCTNGADVTVVEGRTGTLEIHTGPFTSPEVEKNGTLTSNGAEVTVELFGAHCIYKTENTDIGTVTGSANTGGTATLDIKAEIPRVGGRSMVLCGSKAPWTGSYKVSTPDSLNVD